MKKLINNRYVNLYLNAAVKHGLDYVVLSKKAALVKIFNKKIQLTLSSNVLDINTHLSAVLAENKKKTSTLLQENGIPVPKFATFTHGEKATKYALDKLVDNTFIVTKPLSGSLSVGITVKPTTTLQVQEAVREAFEGRNEIIIEEYVPGNHYRITVVDNEVIAITQRIPANVTGDGIHTLAQLIEQKNVTRLKKKLPQIVLRVKDYQYLKSQNIHLKTIYGQDTVINLQLGCDLDIGGERVRIDRNAVPEINKDLFTRAAATLKLRFAGIDYISPDITVAYTDIHTAINEINSAPDLDVHFRDRYPADNYAAERVIEKIFRGFLDVGIVSTQSVKTATLPYSVPRAVIEPLI